MSRKGKRSENSALLSVSVPKELKEQLEFIAKEDGRTLSNLIRHIVTQAAKRSKKTQ